MGDKPITIKFEGDEGAGTAVGWTSGEEGWIKDLATSQKRVRIRIPASDDDVEGHALSTAVSVVVSGDDDDVEGHAMSLHFPSVQEANEFRRRLLAAGLITATVAIGAAGGAALGSAAVGGAAGDASTVSGQYSVENMGGTPAMQQQAANQGQYTIENQGGTPAMQQQAANQGQYTIENQGGTPAMQQQATNQGQYTAENLGGVPASTAGEGQGQYNVANMGGTPQAPADTNADDDAALPHSGPTRR
jgi:hypothetical protein